MPEVGICLAGGTGLGGRGTLRNAEPFRRVLTHETRRDAVTYQLS